ncbi:MAG: hypothetical protein NZ949_00640 [Candidatus Kapabacteria bacterium]|nr:hypothetical protein [Candidatus Kapabacteria bacterium]
MPYTDNPAEGHPDVRTQLPDVAYFFLGNGHLTAVVQHSPREGTPLALALMHPEQLGPKRAVLNMHPMHGLTDTLVRVQYGTRCFTPDPLQVRVEWDFSAPVPTVSAQWQAGDIYVVERFFCPDRRQPRLLRELLFQNSGPVTSVRIQTGLAGQQCETEFPLTTGGEQHLALEYGIELGSLRPYCRWTRPHAPDEEAIAYWGNIHRMETTEPRLTYLFSTACWQLPATIAVSGRMDASIWQYNLEWVRDHCMNVFGLLASGHHELARAVLERVVREFVRDDGSPIDSSRARPPELVELDQNGVLLAAVYSYVCWTDDIAFAREWWHKLISVAEYPFRFRAKRAFLLCNAREYWERMPLHGVEEGFELAYQVWMAVGWEAAARLAKLLRDPRHAARWASAAIRIRRALLSHPRYRLVESGRFVKRRRLTGEVQWELFPQDHPAIPPGVPLRTEPRHWLNPDASAVLPITLGLVEACSLLARRTLHSMEDLWNQRWDGGGYGRYHVSSEPDSPGPWPLASLLIARAYAKARSTEHVWRVLKWLLALPQARSGAWFEFYGPRPVPPCPQVGILLWNWSELLQLLFRELAGIWVEDDVLSLAPWLPDGIEAITVECRWRGRRRVLRFCSTGEQSLSVHTNMGPLSPSNGRIKLPDEVQEAEIRLPAA